MKNKRFKNVVLCAIVTSMLLASTVTYGQGTFIDTEDYKLEEANEEVMINEEAQLIVKPGHEVVEMKVGETLNHAFLKEHVTFDNGSSLEEGYEFEPVFISGDRLFEEGVAVRSGKASIRIRVKGLENDSTMVTEACLKLIIKEDCTTNPEPEEKVINHMPYIYGYEDGTFRADRGVSREELASMVSRLILEGNYPAYENEFIDLSDGRYSANHVAHLDALGIMKGYGDQTFHPHEKITRGEMAAVIERAVKTLGIGPAATGTVQYADSDSTHWAYESILFVTENGYMEGKEVNGAYQFLPDEMLTRAEAVITLNKVFERVCDDAEIPNPYSDLDRNHWAYIDILYASVVHEHKVNK